MHRKHIKMHFDGCSCLQLAGGTAPSPYMSKIGVLELVSIGIESGEHQSPMYGHAVLRFLRCGIVRHFLKLSKRAGAPQLITWHTTKAFYL